MNHSPEFDVYSFVAERFWSLVDQSGDCWLWPIANNKGYGSFRLGNSTVQAHRFAWMLERGSIPDGLLVCHNCPDGDNPLCVRPDHLFFGTKKDNSQDSIRKGRSFVGVPRKITSDGVREIRERYERGGVSTPQLAREFDIGQSTVMHILKFRIWKDV